MSGCDCETLCRFCANLPAIVAALREEAAAEPEEDRDGRG